MSDHYAESEEDKYLRLVNENEHLYENPIKAEEYMQKYLAKYEGDSDKMVYMGKFYLRLGKHEKADEYFRDAYSFQIKN